jgi:hypothetical protein
MLRSDFDGGHAMAIKRFPVEASHIMMFARSVGDFNPVYHDEEAARQSEAGGIIAPPTFGSAGAQFDPDYGLRPRPGVPWFGSGKHPSGLMRDKPAEPKADKAASAKAGAKAGGDGAEAAGEKKQSGGGRRGGGGGGGGGLHAEQHFEYHRHLRPGDVLTAKYGEGRSWEKQSKRAGLLKFSERVTEYYDQNGELVLTARSVGMRTERVIDEG